MTPVEDRDEQATRIERTLFTRNEQGHSDPWRRHRFCGFCARNVRLWLLIFCIEAQTIVATGRGEPACYSRLSTVLFVGVHVQFWYEESEQGRRFHRTMERMRGRIYEDEFTGCPTAVTSSSNCAAR